VHSSSTTWRTARKSRRFSKPSQTRDSNRSHRKQRNRKPRKNPQRQTKAPEAEETGLTVEIPLDKVAVGTLTNILEAKGSLIKKALGIDDLRFEIKEDRIAFPWFPELPDTGRNQSLHDVHRPALQALQGTEKRISSTETPVANEKYAFRCFLLRLGFIGARIQAGTQDPAPEPRGQLQLEERRTQEGNH
jgi:hypothetical protein